ncbi:MAG: cbb3-type cytochrome c oxidase subunit I [Gammaproteobacteria bacterium]|nr:cbb3-type cytochrome c oxidase subunit I [Gammaproteobacteria bacterium]
MSNDSEFRTCPDTGLRIHLPAEKLMKANAVAAVVFLLIGGIFGLAVALTRWPAVHLLPAEWFYIALTAHGVDVLVVWIIFFEMAILYFTSTVLLNSRLATPKVGWVAFALMLIGAVMANIVILDGSSTVMFTSYPPLKANPLFYLGLILFAVGALLVCFVFLGTLVIAKHEKTYEGSLPLVVFGALIAAIIAVFTIASGAIILIPTFLWSLGLVGDIDPQMYRLVWWAFGHSSQQINMAAQIAIWYAIAALLFGAKPLSEKVSRMAFFLYLLALQLGSAHHLLSDPGGSMSFRVFNTSYAMYIAVLGSMIHAFTIPGSIEAAQREKGLNNGLFEWLRKAPWDNPVFSGMFLSLVLFGFIGGITGVTMSVQQINMIIHNTAYVPGHFHGTVAAGTTLSFMALTYWLLPVLWRRDIFMPKVAQWSTWMFGLGMGGFAIFFMAAGHLGVARRHWDMTFAGNPLGFEYSATVYLFMGAAGITAVIGSLGALAYILCTVGTILFGKRRPENAAPVVSAEGVEAITSYGNRSKGWEAPGSLVLVAVFMVFLVVYYFANWKYLGSVWGIR